MPTHRAKNTFRVASTLAALSLGAVLFSASRAEAHFRLLNPPQWIEEEDTLGDPQKAAPCGVDSTITYTLTNVVTSYAPGQTITLHFIETVAHDGWFRISLSYANRTDLTDPPYQTNPINGWSVDAGIEDPPVAPVLVDGLFQHTAASITVPKDYTYNLTLPTALCTKCTLQVEQIMLNHPVNQADGPFTYHHCADIAIVAGGDGGSTAIGDASVHLGVPPSEDDASSASSGASSGGASSGTGTGGSSGSGASSDGTDGGESTGGSGGTGGTSNGASSSGSSGCATGGRGTSAAAGFGLLVGAAFAGIRRRRRTPR